MAKTKVHGKRSLLNRSGHESTAAIVAEIENTSGWKPGCDQEGRDLSGRGYVKTPNYTFQVANCDRSVAFDLAFEEPDDRANNLFKIDVLIDALTAFRAGVAIEQERYADRAALLKDD